MQTHIHTACIVAKVIENHSSLMMPTSHLTVATPHAPAITVVYHSEFPPSTNLHAGDVGYQLKEGDEIEVYAEIVDDDTLSTCDDDEYYIRVLSECSVG